MFMKHLMRVPSRSRGFALEKERKILKVNSRA